jgi:hypothetical protein
MTGIKCAALAGVFMLTAGSMAWAQSYNTNQGTQGYSNAGNQSASGQSSSGSITSDTQQKIRQSLEQSGFKNVQVLPEAFVIRAQAPDGSRVAMLLSPDRVAEVVMGNSTSTMQGTSSQPYGAQSNWQSGNGSSAGSQQQAQQELSRYGYSDLSNVTPMRGWSADATRNGENVHVLLSDNGLVATFPGR